MVILLRVLALVNLFFAAIVDVVRSEVELIIDLI